MHIYDDREIDKGSVNIKDNHTKLENVPKNKLRNIFDKIDLESLNRTDFKAQTKFCNLLGIIERDDWKIIYSAYRSIHISNKVKDIQYKILHRILATNSLLYKMRKIPSQLCIFCSLLPETIEHLMYECFYVYNFWLDVQEIWINKLGNVLCNFDKRLVILGSNGTHDNDVALNIILLLGKHFIWSCKQQEKGIQFNLFSPLLESFVDVYWHKDDVKNIICNFIAHV